MDFLNKNVSSQFLSTGRDHSLSPIEKGDDFKKFLQQAPNEKKILKLETWEQAFKELILQLQCAKSQNFGSNQQTLFVKLVGELEEIVLYLAALQNLDLLHPIKRRMQPLLRRVDWLYDDVRYLEERLELKELDEKKLEEFSKLIVKFKMLLL